MSNTIRQTTIYPAKIELTERDQYNDYSVVCDYTLIVEDKNAGYFRRFNLGTDKAKAIRAYDVAVSAIYRAQAQAQAA